jgi:hypothetical protein
MIRRCDGTDVNLIRAIRGMPDAVHWREQYVPCDCGMTFDDVKRGVIYPHDLLLPTVTFNVRIA